MKVFVFLITFFIFSAPFTNLSYAESDGYALITWQAENFYPSNFEGRVVPTNKTKIKASAELIKDQKLVDSSKFLFSWYVDGDFFLKGVGQKEISFNVRKSDGDSHSLRVSISTGSGSYGASSLIPISEPMVVIDSELYGGQVKSGQKITLSAIPFFFTNSLFSDLSFLWKVNGIESGVGTENSVKLEIGTPKTPNQTNLLVDVIIKNSKNMFEIMKSSLTLKII